MIVEFPPNTPLENIPAPDPRMIEWNHEIARTKLYSDIKEQLDMLYKDIDAGFFGENAKNSTWYQHIKEVKETHPVGSVHKPYADLPGPSEIK